LDNTFTGKAVVSLIARAATGAVDAANCFTPDFTQTLDNAATSFVAGKLTVNGTVVKAYPDARIKVVCDATNCPPSGITACSADNFAVRPGAITLSSSTAMATPPSATATPTLVAGVGFIIKGTTSTSATDAYAGTLTLDASKLTAQDTSQDTVQQGGGAVGTLSLASFAANQNPVSTNATYTEVGYLYFAPGAYRDDAFTSVDQPGACAATNTCDCVTSTTSDANLADTLAGGKYGCSIGNTVAASFGRFRTDHFDTTVTNACVGGGFTYSGQPFPLKVTAKNAAGGTTANYTGSFAKTVTLSDANGAAGAFNPLTLTAGNFVGGVADLTAAPSVAFTYTSKLTAPSTLKVRVTNTEGDSSTGTEGTATLRSGRLRIANAFGSEQLALRMAAQTEYYNGSAWATNTDDNCTTFATLNGPTSFTPALGTATPRCFITANTCTSTDGVACNDSAASSKVANGSVALCVTKPGTAGFVDVTFATPPYLQFNGVSPSARASFGLYSNPVKIIDRREFR
jgi:hypothetical protein